MGYSWDRKFDPDEIMDFWVDWTNELDGDTISTNDFAIPTVAATNGLTIDATKPSSGEPISGDSLSAGVWLKFVAGDLTQFLADQPYYLINTVTTAGSRTYQRSIKLKVREL
jgi:hypothetical protein